MKHSPLYTEDTPKNAPGALMELFSDGLRRNTQIGVEQEAERISGNLERIIERHADLNFDNHGFEVQSLIRENLWALMEYSKELLTLLSDSPTKKRTY